MRTSALAGGRKDFYPVMGQQERERCRMDLDMMTDGLMTAQQFIDKWRDALRAVLITRL